MVHGVHRGGDRQQRLGGADVGRGLFAADVLLAGLQGQAVGRGACRVLGNADQAARKGALQAVAHCQVGCVRAAEEQRNAEALGVADGDVGTLLARGGDQGQGQDVGGDGDHRTALLGGGDDCGVVDDGAVVARLLQHDAGDVTLGQALGQVGDFDLEAEGVGAALDHGDGLREEVCIKHGLGGGLGLVGAAHQQHCLGNGGCFVEHRGVGDRQAGQVHDHGLEVQQCLEAALGDFRLVRGVGGVPGRVLKDVAQDHRRGVGVGETLADHLGLHDVLAGEHAEIGKDLGFGARRQAGSGARSGGCRPERPYRRVRRGRNNQAGQAWCQCRCPGGQYGGRRTQRTGSRSWGTPLGHRRACTPNELQVPPRPCCCDLRVSALLRLTAKQMLAPSVSRTAVAMLLLSRVASSRRYGGLRVSRGGIAPTAPDQLTLCGTLPPHVSGCAPCEARLPSYRRCVS